MATDVTGRASSEEDGDPVESTIKTLYLFTFDNAGTILQVPGTTDYYIRIPGTVTEVQRVDVNAKSLLVIANPGSKMVTDVIGSMGSSITAYTLLNAAIKSVDITEVANDANNYAAGFTMINSGDETGKSTTAPDNKIDTSVIDISDYIKKVEDYPTVQQAQNAAQAEKVTIHIERLASKIEFKKKANITVEPTSENTTFSFIGWTLDALNTEFYPFAKKTILAVQHTFGGSYVNNFYTEDPNFAPATVGDGLAFVKVNSSTYVPEFPVGTEVSWMGDGVKTYQIENTMEADEQKYGNATRVVVKGTYYPDGNWTPGSDWFSFAGVNYETLEDLQDAYDKGGANLVDACDRMYNDIEDYITANSISGFTVTDFASLTAGDLALIQNNIGGEIIKSNSSIPCIRWYQGGMNYYYYEIQHDNSPDIADMAFGKYGIVRNNWYELTLGKVSGAGTPWYPDINNPGPGDPDPVDPIDEEGGYLGIELKIKPWIFWQNEISI
ncbi:MAG: Mfa1 family fimbria major subunit [Bacteroides sp.]|nr:Mfa1 family fimbria major subunit [Bacteroides sp.]